MDGEAGLNRGGKVKQEIRDPESIIWEAEGAWLGYLREYPDLWTQGDDLEDLREHLCDLLHDITAGSVPGIARREDG